MSIENYDFQFAVVNQKHIAGASEGEAFQVVHLLSQTLFEKLFPKNVQNSINSMNYIFTMTKYQLKKNQS